MEGKTLENNEFIKYMNDWRTLNANYSELIPIYMKDWYWDAVCESKDKWHVVCVYNKNDEIEAAFPFVLDKRKGLIFIELPWQVPCAGLWLRSYERSNKEKAINYLRDMVDAILSKLPTCDCFNITFNNNLWTWHPFYWKGFECRPLYTSIVNSAEVKDFDFKSTISKYRRKRVNQAEKIYTISADKIEIDDYWNFFESTYCSKDKEISYNSVQFKRLLDALISHDSCEIRCVYDYDRKLVAENIVLKDSFRMYHQFGTQLSNEHSNATSYAVYDAITNCCNQGLIFDFEGSMIPGVFEFNSSWNPELEVHYNIYKYSLKYKIFDFIRMLIKRKTR